MQYTLDSIVHVVNALKETYKSETISVEPLFTSDLNTITKTTNKMYFGLIVFGSNCIKAKLLNESDNEILTVLPNSQIIELFSSLSILDDSDVIVPTPFGQFRGYEITIK